MNGMENKAKIIITAETGDLNKKLDSASQSVDQFGKKTAVSAGQAAAALRMVPAQMTDIFVSLQAGQDPMTVLIQQGGQLKDMFGGVVPAAKALGGYIVGLVNPFTVATAAAGGLAYAYAQGAKEADAYSKSIIMSGNAVGTTVGQMQDMATAISDSIGATRGAASEAILALMGAGNVGSAQMERFSAVAIKMQKEAGIAIDDTAKAFSELGAAPTDAVAKLNEKTNFLTAALYDQIKALEDQGQKTEAARVAQEAYADAMESRADKLTENLGYVERAWRGVTGAAKGAWDAMLDIGRSESPMEKITELQDKLATAQANYDASRSTSAKRANQEIIDSLRTELNALVSKESALQKTADAEAKSAAANRAAISAIKAVTDAQDKGLTKQQQMTKALEEYRRQLDAIRSADPNSKLLSTDAIASGERAIRDRFSEKVKEQISDYARLIASIKEKISAQNIELATGEKANEGEKLRAQIIEQTLSGQLKLTAAQKEFALALANELDTKISLIALQKEANEANAKFTSDVINSAAGINKQAVEQEKANKAFGLGKSAVAELTLAEMQHSLEMQLQSGEYIPDYIDAMESRIDAQKRLVAALKEGENLEFGKKMTEESKKSAEDAAKEWQKTAEKINDTLTDALMRGFESGKSFAENMRDTIVNMFKTMVLRPVVSAIVQPVSNFITSAIGGGTSYGSSGGIGYINAANSLYSAYTGGSASASIAAQWLSGSMSSANAAGTLYANAAGTGLDGLLATNGAYGTAPGAGSGAGASSSLSYLWPLAIAYGMYMSGKLYGQGFSDEKLANEGSAGWIFDSSTILNTGMFKALGVSDRFANIITGAPLQSLLFQKLFGGETRGGGSYSWGQSGMNGVGGRVFDDVTYVHGPSGGEIAGSAVRDAIGGTVDSIKKILSAVESSSTLVGFQAALETSGKGRGGVLAGGLLSNGVAFGEPGTGSNYSGGYYENNSTKSPGAAEAVANLAVDLQQATLQAIKAAGDVPNLIASQLATVDIEALSASETETLLQSIIDQINSINSLRATFDSMPFSNLADLSFKAAAGLVELAGTIDDLTASIESYYSDFYSEAERMAISVQNMQSAFDVLDLAMPQTKDAFRDLVNGQDLATESGRETYIALLGLSAVFADIAEYAESIRSQALAAAQSDTDTAYSAVERAVQAQQEIADAAIEAANEQISAMESLFDVLSNGIKDLYGEADASIPATAGRSFIGDALASFRASGYLPDADELADALSSVKLTMVSDNYASAFEMQRDQYVLAGQLAELQSGASTQKSVAEQQLEAAQAQSEQLDGVLEAAQAQINALRGIDDSVLAVAAAVQSLAAAMAAESLITNTAATISNIPAFASGGYFAGGLRVVGEKGPELEVTGPSRIYSASDTARMLSDSGSGDNSALVAELRQLRDENRAQAGTVARLLNELSRIQSRWDRDGMPNARLEATA